MERITRARVGALLLVFCLIIGFFCFILYDMQVILTGGDTNNITTFETLTRVKAARGNILDTNGNVLVTNRASYDLVINHYVLTSSVNPNQTLYALVKLCQSKGIQYTDHLPITKEAPFVYTLSDYNSTWQNHFQIFLAYRDNLDSDITAPLLMKKLRESYGLPEEWSDTDARAVLGLRYELSLRNCVPSLSNYVFLSDVDTDTLAAVLELNVPGMNVEASTVRQYNTKYAAHILGYVGAMSAAQWEQYKKIDGYSMDALIGQDGLEKAFEEYLHGTDGTRVDVVTKDGTLVKSYYLEEPKAGQNVQVSIDLNLQAAAEDALAIAIENLRNPEINTSEAGRDAVGAAVVAMDIKTGQVLVCGSYPTYDLSTLFENYNELLEAEHQPMFNRALQAEYPPGSTYKMSMVIAGINSQTINTNTIIKDEGSFTKYEGFSVDCMSFSHYGYKHGEIDCKDAIKFSCNYFFYELADRMKIETIDTTAKNLGLGEYTGIELYERIGHRSNPDTKAALYTGDDARWYAGDKVLTGIGQAENRFTPMQLCSYTATIVNRGTRYKATFLNRVVSSDYRQVVYENAAQVLNQSYISDEAWNAVTTGMLKVTTEQGGTARSLFDGYPIKVAAKTGTAQTGVKGHSDNGAFVCYAPADNPQVAIAVYGERISSPSKIGPVAKAILDAYFGVDQNGGSLPGENEIS